MSGLNETIFLVATLILWGFVFASKPLLNKDKFFQPKSYWFLAFIFTASSFTFFSIAPSVNLVMLTLANTCFVAGNLYMALFMRFLRKPKTTQFSLLPLLVILIFGFVFEYIRLEGVFLQRVLLVGTASFLCLFWQFIELILLDKALVKKLRFLILVTFVEMALALARVGLLFFQDVTPGMNLYQEPLTIAAIRWAWFAFGVISYMALIGYLIEDLNLEKIKSLKEINGMKLDLASKKLEQAEIQFLESLNILAKARDNETGNHIIRTQNYVKVLALRLRKDGHYVEELTDKNIDLIFKVAPLHDIGKIGIPDKILLKRGPLTDEEWTVMKTHTLIGESVLNISSINDSADRNLMTMAINIARSHHEKWDGTGYPHGLQGLAIPLPARIMALADMYDALVNERVYKKAWTHDQAAQEICSGRSTQFDPLIVDAFIAELNAFIEISENYRDI